MPTHSQLWLHHYQLEFLVIRVVECASRCRLTRKVPGKPNEAIWQIYHGFHGGNGGWKVTEKKETHRKATRSPLCSHLRTSRMRWETPQRASWKGSKKPAKLKLQLCWCVQEVRLPKRTTPYSEQIGQIVSVPHGLTTSWSQPSKNG